MYCENIVLLYVGMSFLSPRNWVNRIYHLGDYDELISSGCLFARKFSYTDMHIVDKILIHITADQE